ncbi:MAG: glycosyltransferase, partial [Elusimicrobia bacterium]|nr:glycosyltransferase [Elusimicrobiota bacterium]
MNQNGSVLEPHAVLKEKEAVDVSVVVYTDVHLEGAAQLYAYVANLLREKKKSYEFLFVDDGNSEETLAEVKGIQKIARNVRLLRLDRPLGVGKAMSHGFRQARGRWILTVGPFLQVQPFEIRKMFEKTGEGYDLVNGWRVQRSDFRLNRMESHFYNWLIRKASRVALHDFNCTLKLFRRELVQDSQVQGELYRFFPILAALRGFSVCEVPLKQRTEINRVGIYRVGTYWRLAQEFVTLLIFLRLAARPYRIFGVASVLFLLTGFASAFFWVSRVGLGPE